MGADGWPGDDFDPGTPLTETSIHGRQDPYLTGGCLRALFLVALYLALLVGGLLLVDRL